MKMDFDVIFHCSGRKNIMRFFVDSEQEVKLTCQVQ